MITFQRALQLIRNGLYVNSIFNSLKKNKKIGFIYAMYTISKRCRLLFYGKMPFFLRAWKKIKPMIREYFLSLFIRLKLLICVFTDFFSVVFSCLFVFLFCFVRVFFFKPLRKCNASWFQTNSALSSERNRSWQVFFFRNVGWIFEGAHASPLTNRLDRRAVAHFRPPVNRPHQLVPIRREEGNVQVKTEPLWRQRKTFI